MPLNIPLLYDLVCPKEIWLPWRPNELTHASCCGFIFKGQLMTYPLSIKVLYPCFHQAFLYGILCFLLFGPTVGLGSLSVPTVIISLTLVKDTENGNTSTLLWLFGRYAWRWLTQILLSPSPSLNDVKSPISQRWDPDGKLERAFRSSTDTVRSWQVKPMLKM